MILPSRQEYIGGCVALVELHTGANWHLYPNLLLRAAGGDMGVSEHGVSKGSECISDG